MSETDERDEIREQKAEELQQRAATADEPVHVESPDHFDDLTESGVVLVDFYADWCGPCKMIAPTLETLAAETAATVAKVDVDERQDLAREYDVQGVPTLFLYVDGEQVERLVGAQDEMTLRSLIEQHA
jgi:thioredoxin 1